MMSVGNRWECPRCGCGTNHFSTAKEKYVCDACGYVIESDSDRRQKEQYTRMVSQAKRNLQVGNWESCSSIIRPMLNEYPADTLLYLILLAALTKGYEDYLFDNDDAREEAAAVWDKLERLGSINPIMQQYAVNCQKERRNMLSSRISTAALLMGGIILGLLLSTAFSPGALLALVVLCAFYALRKITKHIRPVAAIKELNEADSSNPFK